jgi:5'-3' exonuclease
MLKKEKPDSKNRVILIDASALAYAALHSTGHLSYNNRPTGVKFGFLRRIVEYAEKFKTNDFIFCWDNFYSHREKIYPEYKLKRKTRRKETVSVLDIEMRKSFLLQVNELKKSIIPELGFKNSFEQHGFEADDLLAYWAKKLSSDKTEVIMVTGDHDMFQCLDCCYIWHPTTKKKMTRKMLKEKYGVEPEEWALAKAIGGCSGDQVEGIKGASDPKKDTSKALKYIQGELKSGVIFDRIISEEGQKIIERNKDLVYLPFPPIKLKRMVKRKNKFNRKGFIRVFDTNRFISFLDNENFKKWELAFGLQRR